MSAMTRERFRRRAMSIDVSAIEGDVPPLTRLGDGHLEDSQAVHKLLVGIVTGPIRNVAPTGNKTGHEREEGNETGSPAGRGRGKRAHE